MPMWRKQDTGYLSATVAAVALAACATLGLGPSGSESIHVGNVEHELVAPFIAPAQQVRTKRVVRIRDVVVRVPSAPRVVLVTPSPTTEPTAAPPTSKPVATPAPTVQPAAKRGKALGKMKDAARTEREGASDPR